MTPLQRQTYDQVLQLQRQEKIDPKNIGADKIEFSKKCSWDTCVVNAEQKRQLEEFLFEYHDVFAKNCFDVGYSTALKIKLTPGHLLPVYVQGPPAPIHVRDGSFI